LVTKKYIALVLCFVAACGFDQKKFDDRKCNADPDCRPDQTCTNNFCTQVQCVAAADCGASNEFDCTAGLCVARDCLGPSDCSLGYACTDGFCRASFNVVSVMAVSQGSIMVTFDAPPDPTTATTLDNYTVGGLTLSGTPVVSGNTVTITTAAQAFRTYTLIVANVTRASDGVPLTVATSGFTGRPPFDVSSAGATSNTSILVAFDAPPDPAAAMTLSNYSIPGLTVIGMPMLFGTTVLIATSPQTATPYTVTVSNVVRSADSEPLLVASATFTGRTDFDVASAASTSSGSITVTFNAPPNAAQATTLANYSVGGLALLGTPSLSGNTVTILTSPQTAAVYTVSVTGVTRASDAEPLTVGVASFFGIPPFDVASAASAGSVSMTVTFDFPPNVAQATTLGNYSVPGLTLSGTPTLAGNTVTIATSTQSATTYTVTVSGVARASDTEPLSTNSATFTGRPPFDVAGGASTSAHTISVTFDAPPNGGQATTLANYSVPGLTLSGIPALVGNTVVIATAPQTASSYTVTVSNVTRASDAEPLTGTMATFTGRAPFDVASASSLTSHSIRITFDAAPNAAEATTLGNYAVPGLTLSGTPTLAGNVVTVATSPQSGTAYTVTVSNVTRATDAEPLTIASANFTGRLPFDVASATSTTSHSITVSFDAAPNAGQATTLANYTVPGLTLTGTPTLAGNIVTITTLAQSATPYTVTVSGVTRAGDAEPLTTASATFNGRTPFDVTNASSTTAHVITVTFDAPPNAVQATTLANYSVLGLTLSGTPSLSGSTVTIATSPQAATSYTVTVSGVTRATDAEALTVNSASFTGRSAFNVASAAAVASDTITVTFDAPPNASQATTITNYSVPGLTLSGAPSLSGNTVTILTSPQAASTYTVTVSTVTRALDGEPLTVTAANFTGRTPFNVTSAASITSGKITVTFDAPPTSAEATVVANYDVPGLTLGTATLAGNVVTITTSPQSAITYTVTVSGVTRASDGENLTTTSASFTGRTRFNVASAASITSHSITVTFDAPPNAGQATTLGNYAVPGLTLSGAPVLAGSTVTITTSPQSNASYVVTVSNVTRASDAEALTLKTASFTGRTPFDVVSAASTSSTSITVTFDAAPNAAAATTVGNFSVAGLTLSSPTLIGNTVTLTTSPQSAVSYGVSVSNVTRASDAEALTVAGATFTGRAPFDVASAASASNLSITVTFDAPPNAAQATNINNYSVAGLALSGTPSLSGSTVTITTASQLVTSYTVVVSGVTRNSDGELLTTTSAGFTGRSGFNVASAASTGRTTITVTFDAPPTMAQATTLGNYSVSGGLALSGMPVLAGNTVTITTATQAPGNYTVTVSNVTRASDSTPLTVTTATFTHASFNVASAVAVSHTSLTVTFDAPPTAAQATTLGNYSVPGLTLSGTPSLSGNTVTITSAGQSNTSYTVTVNNVTRASDGEPLVTKTATFTGRASFDVASAAGPTSASITVTFNAAPDPTQAATLAAYAVPGLTLIGTPLLSGNTVTIQTSQQSNVNYTVTVTGVTRASDGEPLTGKTATFAGNPVAIATVTNVVVQSTNPSNGTIYYNTGTVTVVISGTDFAFVTCLTGVALNDLDGAGAGVNTHPTSCTVDSDTQITATFPSGVRTNGNLGWDVRVTNSAGTNTTSAVKLVPKAGLLISEVYIGATANNSAEFLQLYNPTANSLNMSTLGMAIHLRSGGGSTDNNMALTIVNATVPSHHFVMIASTASSSNSWWSHRDVTYNTAAIPYELASSRCAYVSLSATAQSKVLDKVGWNVSSGTSREGTALPDIFNDNSVQRKPAGGAGAATDTDNNNSDFNAQNTSITVWGTADPAQP
jgi:hypothetical protein